METVMRHLRTLRGVSLCGVGALCLAAGCSHFRGIPSHGGGKRFDEEQRAMAGAIRRTIATMEVDELKGKRTGLVISSIYTSGSGTTNWSGLQDITLMGNRTDEDRTQTLEKPPHAVQDQDWNLDREYLGASGRYRAFNSYRAANHHTEADLRYFRAALEMKARHNGLNVVTQKPEAVLHVLVDVLGTNRSRRDFLVVANEDLLASCEVTYYAQEVKTGKLIFRARQTGAAARYREHRIFWVPHSMIRRSVRYAKPIYYDVDGESGKKGDAGEPIEIPKDLGEVRRAYKHMDEKQREEMLESLDDRARFHIQSGNAQAADEYVETIRQIDPGYKGLGDLSEDLEKMKSAGK
jgi:hypothetical protein